MTAVVSTVWRGRGRDRGRPGGVRFGLPLTGPVTRFLAWDGGCAHYQRRRCGAVVQGLEVVKALSADWYAAAATLAWFVISIGYGMLFEWWWAGQNASGKCMFALRVAPTLGGLKLSFHQIAIRNLIRFVDSLPLFYLLGGASLLFTRDAQRPGDVAAGTVVVRLSRLASVDPAASNNAGNGTLAAGASSRGCGAGGKRSDAGAGVGLRCRRWRAAMSWRWRLRLRCSWRDSRKIRHDRRACLRRKRPTMTDEQFVRNVLQVVLSGPGRQA